MADPTEGAAMDERIERTVEIYEAVAERYQSLHGDRSDVEPIVEGFRERVAEAVSTDDDERAADGPDVDGPDANGPDVDERDADRPPLVVDVGCGPGWETATLSAAGLEVVGLDIAPSFLAAARQRAPAATFVRGDMRRLPVETNAVDGVLALASLLHVPAAEVGDALAAFARALADGGVLTVVMKLVGGEAEQSPYGDADRRHFEFYEREQLLERVEAAGFVVEATDRDDHWFVVHAQRR